MATIQITLKSRKKRDGTYPVVIRICHHKQYLDIPTNESIPISKFDRKRGRIIGDNSISYHLEELKELYSKKLRMFIGQNTNREFEFEELKSFILQKSNDELTIKEFWEQIIVQLNNSGRTGSATIYKSTYSILSGIISLHGNFSTIGIKDLMEIEKVLRSRGNNWNSIGVYMRTFRAICNKAIQYNLICHEWYPFRNYKIRKEKTIPRVLSLQEIQRYFNAGFLPKSPLYKVWNVGKLLFMLRGINLRDLLFLTKENIKSGRIIYQRGKTGKIYSIKLDSRIIETFQSFEHDRISLLGLMLDFHIQNPVQSISSRALVSKRINKKLKLIGEKLEFQEPLTSYVFRYTYANVAKKLGFSKDLIAEALGHEYGNSVTGIYLELFDQQSLDNMATKILDSVTNQSNYSNQND
ncbi:tyrosine-type recombinase/integrase [Algoriphagus confluentis]|uniref:Site-specific integrase n=1 Tax=Algoriphagus confluentis TaxID=1697556 RepID=A0ABQ6PT30_9BACT|nr:site-specific integrase [Algoriphagus confluentis]